MCFNGARFWLDLSLGGIIRFENSHIHTSYGGNYNNLGCFVIHYGAPVKSWGGFCLVFFFFFLSSVLQLAGEKSTF